MTSQFGGTKNPPWARPNSGASSVTPTSLAQAQNALLSTGSVPGAPVYNIGTAGTAISQQQYNAQITALGMQQAQQHLQQATVSAATVLPQPGIAIPTTLATSQVASVSYPSTRISLPASPKQRVFTGTVTKLHDTFGFVDEDVFFQTSCVKGALPQIGSRVLVEATFNPNMPFKWNATRIQVLANQASQAVGLKSTTQMEIVSGLTAAASLPQPLPAVGGLNHLAANQIVTQSIAGPLLSQQPPPFITQNSQPPLDMVPNQRLSNSQSSRGEPPRFKGLKSAREKDKEKERDRERRDRKLLRLKHSRSPVHTSKLLPVRSRSPLHRRSSRVIPRYVVQIPKLSFDTKEASVMALKSRYSNMYIPSDFFHAVFCWADVFPINRPFPLGLSCGFHIMEKDVEPLEANEVVHEASDADHRYSAKVMLLASPTKQELYQKCCALAETDREHFQHPTRLLQFLVGVRGKNEPMAIGGYWSPSLDGQNPGENPQVLVKTAIRTTKALTGIDLSSCTQWYRFTEISYLRPESTHKGKQVPAHVETVVIFLPDVWACSPNLLEWSNIQLAYSKQLQRKIAAIEGTDLATLDQTTGETEGEETTVKLEPTNHALLDPKSMKIIDLRRELESRNQSLKGLKSQLIARLTKSLKQEKEEENDDDGDDDVEDKNQDEDEKPKENPVKSFLENKYQLSVNPSVIVHPSPSAKNGKFDCSLMSLSVLLDYRPEDNKEHCFEVSLFAELFNEMLMRDFGFQIFQALSTTVAQKEEEKKVVKTEDKKDCKDDTDKEVKSEVPMEEDPKENDNREKDRKEKKEKKKYVTFDPGLLLAFVYFDQNHTGFLLDKDIEEIMHTLGLHLSRAQVRKLVQSVVNKDTFNYRKLTDKPVKVDGDAAMEETSKSSVSAPEKLCMGNQQYLTSGQVNAKLPAEKTQMAATENTNADAESSPQTNMIPYKGALLDIDSVLSHLEKSEKTRSNMEGKMEQMTEEICTMKKSLHIKNENCDKLESELQQVKAELEKEQHLHNKAETSNKKITSVVTDSKNMISQALAAMSALLCEETASVKQETAGGNNVQHPSDHRG